ncbi:hypothetical protein C8R47DRAFT_1004104 [Mycena vitilis]|nr:hypothetical protein C8R47DRAFT_1004104 [Mycena vitilis]
MGVDEPIESHRVQELWFEDGNIVIQAGNSKYRVYRGVLAAHSPVFADMISLPQPADSEVVEGCPFVRLPDPDVEDTVLLKAVFLPQFFMSFPARTEFDTIISCLHLSRKYEIDYLRRRALIHLSSGYRTKLDEYEMSTYVDDYTPDTTTINKIRSWPYIVVIQLVREVDAPWRSSMTSLLAIKNSAAVGIKNSAGTYKFTIIRPGLGYSDGRYQRRHPAFLFDPLNIEGCSTSKKMLNKTRAGNATESAQPP